MKSSGVPRQLFDLVCASSCGSYGKCAGMSMRVCEVTFFVLLLLLKQLLQAYSGTAVELQHLNIVGS
jgi:hypothetical protein